jgi:hypothetical protein
MVAVDPVIGVVAAPGAVAAGAASLLPDWP